MFCNHDWQFAIYNKKRWATFWQGVYNLFCDHGNERHCEVHTYTFVCRKCKRTHDIKSSTPIKLP
jgi:uncharacterized protein YbaR (Trm112 family)